MPDPATCLDAPLPGLDRQPRLIDVELGIEQALRGLHSLGCKDSGGPLRYRDAHHARGGPCH